jgi:hypothetical protein
MSVRFICIVNDMIQELVQDRLLAIADEGANYKIENKSYRGLGGSWVECSTAENNQRSRTYSKSDSMWRKAKPKHLHDKNIRLGSMYAFAANDSLSNIRREWWPKAGGTKLSFPFRSKFRMEVNATQSLLHDYCNPGARSVVMPMKFVIN